MFNGEQIYGRTTCKYFLQVDPGDAVVAHNATTEPARTGRRAVTAKRVVNIAQDSRKIKKGHVSG